MRGGKPEKKIMNLIIFDMKISGGKKRNHGRNGRRKEREKKEREKNELW